jgi:hypothetical protein
MVTGMRQDSSTLLDVDPARLLLTSDTCDLLPTSTLCTSFASWRVCGVS